MMNEEVIIVVDYTGIFVGRKFRGAGGVNFRGQGGLTEGNLSEHFASGTVFRGIAICPRKDPRTFVKLCSSHSCCRQVDEPFLVREPCAGVCMQTLLMDFGSAAKTETFF